jgi:hypothetical protein
MVVEVQAEQERGAAVGKRRVDGEESVDEG